MRIPQTRVLRQLLHLVLLGTLLVAAPAWAGKSSPATPAHVDPLEASLAGEFALQNGQLQDAARHYLDAARSAQDPVLAERAMRIALLADADDLARQAWRLWHVLAPQPSRNQHMLVGSLALRGGQTRDARRELRALYASGDWKLALAALAGAVGKQPKLVVKLLGEAVDDGVLPNQLDAWLGFGGLAERMNQQALVDRIVAQVVARFPDDPRVALLRAQLLRQSGRLDAAREALAGLQRDPALSPELRWSLAGEYEALGDPAKAAALLAQGPQDESVYAQRADLLDKAGDKAGLGALYDELKSGATNPNPLRRLLLGQIAELLQRYDEALSWYASVPGERLQGRIKLRRAAVLHAMGRIDAAFEALRGLEADAAVAEAERRDGYQMEAELRHKDKNVAGERDAFARGLAAFPDSLDLLYARAIMWERQDEIAKAEADFRRILVIDPSNVATLNALGYTLADRTDRYREALELIDRARVADPGNGAIIDSYGWVLYKLGRKREALDYLRRAYALQKDPDIASHLGQVLWELGERDEARRHFDEARKLDPENRSLLRALQETGA